MHPIMYELNTAAVHCNMLNIIFRKYEFFDVYMHQILSELNTKAVH